MERQLTKKKNYSMHSKQEYEMIFLRKQVKQLQFIVTDLQEKLQLLQTN